MGLRISREPTYNGAKRLSITTRESRRRKQQQDDMLKTLMAESSFSEEQLRQLLKDFKQKNPSGRMAISDLEAVFGSLFKQGDPREISQHVLRMFDRDNSGYLEFNEVICALSVSKKGSSTEKMRLAFDMIDSDSSGSIERQELLSLVTALHKLVGVTVVNVGGPADQDTPENHVERMWPKLDQDGDGRVTLDEFCQGVRGDPAIAALLTAQTRPERIAKQFTTAQI